jgi:acylphosphatase
MTDPLRPVEAGGSPGGTRGRFEATVSGRVQGVGFRWYVLDRATDLGLDGWVANAPDGTVVCVAEGDRDALVALETALRSGPAGSRVDAVRTTWTAPTGAGGGFHIRSLGHRGD